MVECQGAGVDFQPTEDLVGQEALTFEGYTIVEGSRVGMQCQAL